MADAADQEFTYDTNGERLPVVGELKQGLFTYRSKDVGGLAKLHNKHFEDMAEELAAEVFALLQQGRHAIHEAVDIVFSTAGTRLRERN